MNYTFPYGRATPFRMAEAADKYHTVCVLDKNGQAAPAESGWNEVGYFLIIQLLALAGINTTCALMAQIQVGIFLCLALLLSWMIGLLTRKIFPYSFILLTLLVVFRHHNEALIYYMIGQWMIVTSIPLLTLAGVIGLILAGRRLNWKSGLLLAVLALLGSLVAMIRESEGTAMIAVLAVFWLVLTLFQRPVQWVSALIGLVILVAPYEAGPSVMRQAIVIHRAAHTNLEAREYNGGMMHGPWHVLTICLGRYDNPYGYYYSDYFGFNLGEKLLAEAGYSLEEVYLGGPEYHEVLKRYCLEQYCEHPGYFAKHLVYSTADYAMFLPYAMFLDSPSRRPVGAHLPVVRHDVQYDDWDFVWAGPRLADGSVHMDRTALRNLNAFQWAIFAFMTAVIISGFWLYRKLPTSLRLLMLGAALVFFFQSVLRILIPMHGWGAVLTYYALFAMVGILWIDHWVRRNPDRPLWRKLNCLVVVCLIAAVLIAGIVRIILIVVQEPLPAGSDLTPVSQFAGEPPVLLEEGYEGYNVVRFSGRYFGFPQGFLPDYEDPDLASRPGVIVADSVEEVKATISARRHATSPESR